MRDLMLLVRQIGDERRSFFRNPPRPDSRSSSRDVSADLRALYGDQTYYDSPNGPVKGIQFQMAQILVFSVVGTTFVSLVISLSLRRDTGELKRKQAGTPVSPAVILGGIVGNGVLMALFMSVLVVGISMIVFGAEVEVRARPRPAAHSLVVGSLAFCALGSAVAAFVPNVTRHQRSRTSRSLPLYYSSPACSSRTSRPRSPTSRRPAAPSVPPRALQGLQPDGGNGVDWGQPRGRRDLGRRRGRNRAALLPLGAAALTGSAPSPNVPCRTRCPANNPPAPRRANAPTWSKRDTSHWSPAGPIGWLRTPRRTMSIFLTGHWPDRSAPCRGAAPRH